MPPIPGERFCRLYLPRAPDLTNLEMSNLHLHPHPGGHGKALASELFWGSWASSSTILRVQAQVEIDRAIELNPVVFCCSFLFFVFPCCCVFLVVVCFFVVVCWLLFVVCCLLFVGCWLLCVVCLLFAACCLLFVVGGWWLVAGCCLFVGCWWVGKRFRLQIRGAAPPSTPRFFDPPFFLSLPRTVF